MMKQTGALMEKVETILNANKYLRFSLESSRGKDGRQWQVTFFMEKGGVVGRGVDPEMRPALRQALEGAEKKLKGE